MSLASEVEAIGGLLKKYYESGPAKKQFYADHQLMKRIYKNYRDINGGTATVGLHIGRGVGIGSTGNGSATPVASKQTWSQTTIPIRYTYGVTQFTGPDIANSRNNPGAFANVMTANMTGLLDDMKADCNRQFFSDGSGALALSTADQDGSYVITVEPYLWAPADKYFAVGQRLDEIDYADGTTQLSADTQAGAIIVAAVTAGTGNTATITGTSAEIGTGKDGDLIGKYGALQRTASSTTTQAEMMGLWGGIHNTDPISSAAYKYDAGDYGNTAVTEFTGPEGQSVDWTISGVANTFQGLATASYSWWKSTVYGNGGSPRAITFPLMDKMLGTLRVTKGAKISALYTTWQVNQKLVDLIRADRRYPDTMELDGGFKVNTYQGLPIIVDNDCPRGTIFFVDESEISMYVKEDFGFVVDGRGNNLFKISGYDGYEVTGKLYANLGFHNRNKHGKIIDILET